jgi:hypothetical protein
MANPLEACNEQKEEDMDYLLCGRCVGPDYIF